MPWKVGRRVRPWPKGYTNDQNPRNRWKIQPKNHRKCRQKIENSIFDIFHNLFRTLKSHGMHLVLREKKHVFDRFSSLKVHRLIPCNFKSVLRGFHENYQTCGLRRFLRFFNGFSMVFGWFSSISWIFVIGTPWGKIWLASRTCKGSFSKTIGSYEENCVPRSIYGVSTFDIAQRNVQRKRKTCYIGSI